MAKKSSLQSKTMWANALVAVAALKVPAVKELVSQDPEIAVALVSLMNMFLRKVSKDAIRLF